MASVVDSAAVTTFLEEVDLRPAGDGTWSVTIPAGWDFLGIPNGGLISSIMTAALVQAVGRPDPITSTAHFLRPASIAPAEIRTEILRTGRSLTTARAVLSQEGRAVAHVISALGELEEAREPLLPLGFEPLPPPDECIGATATGGFDPPAIAKRLNLRLHPDHVGFATGRPNGAAEVSGWVDLPPGHGSALMPLLADALPPAVFNSGLYFGPVPTVELTVHAHARPADGPVAVRFRTDHIGARYLEEDGWIADSSGRLVAVSRQLAVLPA